MKYLRLSQLAALLLVPFAAQAASAGQGTTVGKLSVVASTPFQLHINLSAPINPQAQMIAGPDRLVIDLPDATPGGALHRVAVNKGSVKDVRASLYSTKPLVTRIVVDLISPQWYRIAPDASGLLVTVGGPSANAVDAASTVGWVSTKSSTVPTVRRTSSATTSHAVSVPVAATLTNGANVQYQNGMLTIHSSNATLSEVLFQIQKKTGAEIAIPAGTEQDRVAGDFGPARPSDVLQELLNGSDLNFVVVGSPADPNVLRSVLLSRKQPDVNNATFVQPDTPPVAQNTEPEVDPTITPEMQTQPPPPPPQPQPNMDNPSSDGTPPM